MSKYQILYPNCHWVWMDWFGSNSIL